MEDIYDGTQYLCLEIPPLFSGGACCRSLHSNNIEFSYLFIYRISILPFWELSAPLLKVAYNKTIKLNQASDRERKHHREGGGEVKTVLKQQTNKFKPV